VQALGDQIAEGVIRKGYEIMVERTQETGAGIVTFRKPSLDCRVLVKGLKEQGFIVAPRQGWIRTSPHFYISPEDIEAFLAALP
jgi:selenocysteine lyase/cysteine desulfurase